MKQGEQFGGAVAHILMGVTNRAPEWLPADTRLGNSLIGASFIHAPHCQAQPRRLGVGLLDQRFFCDSIRIVDLDLDHHSATFATPHGCTRLAPTAIALPTQASLVQNAPDRIGADETQSIWGTA